jgi:nitrile hydratase accessory protein
VDIDRTVADLEGLPRRNGELVFEAPWEGRALGMAVAMNEQGSYEWEEFRRRLADEIGRAPECGFYASWIGALEGLLLDEGVLSPSELEERKAEYLSMKREEVF